MNSKFYFVYTEVKFNFSSQQKLSNLQEGDIITFTDAVGNEFTYSVAGIEILQPEEVDDMTSGQWSLTLFTCTYGGAGRVTVRCKKNTE